MEKPTERFDPHVRLKFERQISHLLVGTIEDVVTSGR